MQKSQIQFIEGKISTFFKFANIQKLAKKSKVILRKPKKITPKNFIKSHWEFFYVDNVINYLFQIFQAASA